MNHILHKHISGARALLGHRVVNTPVIQLPAIATLLSNQLKQNRRVEAFFKCENLQSSGSFKYRGALHSLMKLSLPQLRRGVITHSTGNHALALCKAARVLELEHDLVIPITVVISQNINPAKLIQLKATSATIVTATHDHADAIVEGTVRMSQLSGAFFVPPADHVDIVLGQATCIEEFSHQLRAMKLPPPNALVLPSGGGGLLTGAALYCKGRHVSVFGAEPAQGGPRLKESLQRDVRLEREIHIATVADGLRTSVGQSNWQLLRSKHYLAGVLDVREQRIVDTHKLLAAMVDMPIEPSAVVSVAAALTSKNLEIISNVCAGPVLRLGFVLTGGNTLL